MLNRAIKCKQNRNNYDPSQIEALLGNFSELLGEKKVVPASKSSHFLLRPQRMINRFVKQARDLAGYVKLFIIQPQAFKKYGNFVGSDKFGNKYFENYEYKYARNRWIEFAEANRNIPCRKYDELWIEWLYSVAIDPPTVEKELQEATDYDKVSLSRLDKVYKNPYNTSEEWIENNWLHLKGKDYEKIEYL